MISQINTRLYVVGKEDRGPQHNRYYIGTYVQTYGIIKIVYKLWLRLRICIYLPVDDGKIR